jgi:beta-lactamase regulating signal transducer with metallopeptidase domain
MSWDGFAAAVDHLWQSTLFAGLALLLSVLYRRKHARVRYRIWFAASLKFLLPFSLLFALGQRLAWLPAPASLVPRITVVDSVALPVVPINANLITAPGYLIAPISNASRWIWFLGALWLVGGLVLLSYRFVIAMRLRVLRQRAAVLSEGREVESLRRVQARLQARASIRLALSQSTIEPGVLGIFRPVLLLPVGLSQRLEDEQLDSIMAHELTHIRQRDNLTAAVHMLVETIFWFHPLVWWIGSHIAEERECACDEDVLHSGNDPDAYASAILTVCEFYMSSRSLCMAGIMGSNLRTRIETIMKSRLGSRLSVLGTLALVAAAILSVSIPVVYGTAHGVQKVQPPPSKRD